MPNPFIVEPLSKHTASIIFAHGLGDSAAGWAPLAQALSRKPQFAHVRWVLPTAPVAPVTANGGYRMTSWCVVLPRSSLSLWAPRPAPHRLASPRGTRARKLPRR